MKEIKLWDANVRVGRSLAGARAAVTGVDEILKALDHYGIEKALVWHIAQFEYSASEGNRLVRQLVKNQKRLVGCWAVLPPTTGENGEYFFDRMKENNIAALRFFPEQHRYLLRRRVFGEFLDQVVARRIPVLLSVKWGVTWPVIYDLLEEYPEMTCLLCDLGIWGLNRYTWPLVSSFPRVYLESSLLSLSDGGLEATVKQFGAGRVIFGTGFPERYADAAILDLLHAPLTDEEKNLIAGENLKRLLAGVKL
ncbi:MAG TPA: amidohydrolase family protein [bacterium]|nr:amidohydrolase family protein [bacterium]